MVRGLDIFRDYFKDYTDKYILIGGTACDLVMQSMGLNFRATKDLDIVLILEVLDIEFATTFWRFIKEGQYKNRQKSTGKKLFYRFYDPEKKTFPYMIELFSRKPDVFKLPHKSHLTPIPMDEEVSSLSAILMDNDYYDFIKNGKKVTDDLSIISQEYLIPLKSKAYLDLCKLKNSGKAIDSKDIKKHKNDVFRLYQILSLNTDITLPQSMADDMRIFLEKVSDEPPGLKNLGIRNASLSEVIGNLKKIYNL